MLLKHTPEDFIVEEIPAKKWDTKGSFAIFKLTKINLNTEQAIDIISKRFHLINNDIKYSGAKDKHAKTTQYISIPNRIGIDQIKLNDEQIKLEHVGYNSEPLSLGTLKGNKFTIALRELKEDELNNLITKKVTIDKNKAYNSNYKFIIPNYFDEQRFSTNNYETGLAILKKDYKTVVQYLSENNTLFAEKSQLHLNKNPNDYVGTLNFIPKKIALMFIHAVQSHIFNNALSKILLENANKNNIKYTNIKYSQGELIFYNNDAEYNDILISTKELELIGFNTLEMNYYVRSILEESNLTPREFIIRAIPNLSVEGTTRDTIINVENLDITTDNQNKTATLKFELSKGSYATIVIKALVEK
jgi:tRNA pseudouridine13 synthase